MRCQVHRLKGAVRCYTWQ